MKKQKEPEVSSFTDSKQEDEEAENPSISSSTSPTEIIESKAVEEQKETAQSSSTILKAVEEQKETDQSSSTRLKSLEKQKETVPLSSGDSKDVEEAATENPSCTSSTSSASSPSASVELNEIQEQMENETSFSTDSKEVEKSVGHPPPSLVSAALPTSTGLQNVERQRENELIHANFKKLVYDFHRLVMTSRGDIKLGTKVRNYTEKLFEFLSDTESKELEGIELVTLGGLLNDAISISPDFDCLHICHLIAKTLIMLYNSNQLPSTGCNDSVFTKLVKNFSWLCRHKKYSIEFENAYELVAGMLNKQYDEGVLQGYAFHNLCTLIFSLSWFTNPESYNLRKITCINIAKIIVEHEELIYVEARFPMHKLIIGLAECCKRYKEGYFRDALICTYKYMIYLYEKNELESYNLADFSCVLMSIPFAIKCDTKNTIKSFLIILSKIVYTRIKNGSEYNFGLYVHVAANLGQCVNIVNDETVKYRLTFISDILAKEITTEFDGIIQLNFLIVTFNKHLTEDAKECFRSVMLAIAKIIITSHQYNSLELIYVTTLKNYALALNFWHEKDDKDKSIIRRAIFSIANSLITIFKKSKDDPLTVNFSTLVLTLSKYKAYDTNLSIRLACNMIAKMFKKPYKDGSPFIYELNHLCFFIEGFGKWYNETLAFKKALIELAFEVNKLHTDLPNLSPRFLSTLANNFVKFCDDADDEESYNFVLGMYLIAKAVFTNYETNQLEYFNAEELLNFTSAFLKLYGRDDSQKSVRRAVVCIAKRLIQIVTDLKGKYGSVLGYFHVFCNAFSLWNEEDESGTLEQALICMADVVNAQFELKNLNDFFLFDLSILCKSFRKLLDTPSVVKAGLSIAKFVAGCDLNDLLKSNMECLVYFVKSFSSWYEKYDELKSFKDAVHVIAYGTSTQLQNLNYAMGCSSKDLANLALCVSRCPMDDSKQHSNMQIVIVSIAQCLINFQMKKLASCRVKDLGKLTMAFSYWRDNSLIAQSIIFIAQEINVRDKNELRTCKYKYLNYLLTGFSKFFLVNFDGLSSKVLILAACNIVKAQKLDDLKYYDDEFLSLLDNHFSRFSDDWECHEAVIIIRQLIREPKLIFGKTALNVFAEIMEIDDVEFKRLLENETLELSKLALSCSSFMYFDDSCHSLKNTAIGIAKCISDAESNESEKSSNLKSHRYDPEAICNFVLAFTKYTDEEFRAAMSYFAKYIISCGNNVSRIFSDKQMCNLVIAFREWCDNFPSVHLNEFDSSLDMLTEYVVNYTT